MFLVTVMTLLLNYNPGRLIFCPFIIAFLFDLEISEKKKKGNSIDVVEYKQNSSFEEATTVKIEGQNSNFSIE